MTILRVYRKSRFVQAGPHCPDHGDQLRVCGACKVVWCERCVDDGCEDCPECGAAPTFVQDSGADDRRGIVEARQEPAIAFIESAACTAHGLTVWSCWSCGRPWCPICEGEERCPDCREPARSEER